MNFFYSSVCHQGDRPYQEDACLWSESADRECLGFVLSDGMGGENSGDLASQALVDAYAQTFKDACFSEDPVQTLAASLEAGNHQIRQIIREGAGQLGMGATYLAGVVSREKLNWISVGDSPLYLFRQGQLQQVNEDHSMRPILKEQVAKGEITPEHAARHPRRNDLFSAVMGGRIEETDRPTEGLALNEGDVILVASDGIQSLDDSEIEALIRTWVDSGYQGDLCQRLIQAVLEKKDPYQDNVAVMVAALHDPGA
jgi:PPM family protein phosphatase